MIDWTRVGSALAALAATARPGQLLSIGVPLPRWPSVTWLADAAFWQRPDSGLRLAGCGAALEIESEGVGRFAALATAHRGLLGNWRRDGTSRAFAFVGFAFASEGGGRLPNARLWVPELLLAEERNGVVLTLATPADRAQAALARWQARWREWSRPTAVSRQPTFSTLPNPLAEQAFLARGRAALAAIAAGRLDKLVLTRSVALAADAPVDIVALLARLAARHPNCAIFGVGHAGGSFVGASPETLLSTAGPRVCVDALAGTAWREAATALRDDKNRREHDCVVAAVTAALAGICRDIAVPATPEVMELSGLSHLRRRVAARRDPQTSVFDLLARLHPTPAVGGAPTPKALEWLEDHGDVRDAWYTGGIGWLDARGDGDLAVCLRCGLIEADRVTLYAGAGFVAGSDPEQELAETEAKLTAMREALAAQSVCEAAAA